MGICLFRLPDISKHSSQMNTGLIIVVCLSSSAVLVQLMAAISSYLRVKKMAPIINSFLWVLFVLSLLLSSFIYLFLVILRVGENSSFFFLHRMKNKFNYSLVSGMSMSIISLLLSPAMQYFSSLLIGDEKSSKP
uniref:Uncharacterized protein n=1 Tax=Dicentrarchus labrax TaxID=13489 RepID=E6ZGZ4_DICLA|nr:Uncharacterized protein [Dicentrarchus labrax]